MEGVILGLLAAQAVVFAVWAWTAFRVLFRLMGWAQRESGRAMPGPGWTWRSYGAFLRDPAFAGDRRRLGWLTAVMFAMILGGLLLARGAG
ncbi:MAG TPA: hypothetical protein VLA78_00775 [Paracoccaceae bacterium]|nr:hypothetical protein [Paracoccaceae bacterium]